MSLMKIPNADPEGLYEQMDFNKEKYIYTVGRAAPTFISCGPCFRTITANDNDQVRTHCLSYILLLQVILVVLFVFSFWKRARRRAFIV
jgi:hypothetical protein